MCSPHTTCPHLSVTSERWQMADWPDTEENPIRVSPGPRSDVTTTSAAGSSRRPALLCVLSVAQTCCHGLLWQQLKKRHARSERRGEQWWLLGWDDREDNNSISLTAEIIPLLSYSYTMPLNTWYLLSFWFVPLFSCRLYLPFQQPNLPAAVEIISLSRPADFSCWSSCFALFALNTEKTP